VRTGHKLWVGHSVDVPAARTRARPEWSTPVHYRVLPKAPRSRLRSLERIVVSGLLVVLALGLGVGGGAFIWFHQSLLAVSASSPDLRRAAKELDVTLPGQATTALVLGDNQRTGIEASAGGRSDTILLVRADPRTNTISLLSLPRDLQAPVYCPRNPVPLATTRIDYAFADCGAAGSLETVERLTGLPINYLITVGFNGFKEIVNDFGGIWLNIDRSYYNKNVGTAATDYSNIDLQPGYQLLSGGSALEFVRFRHTDSDFYRQARQQEFLRALKSQVTQNFDPLKLPEIVSAITRNIKVAACKSCLSDTTVLRYALFAALLPPGHLIQNYISDTAVAAVNVGGADELQASSATIAQAVYQFTHPNVGVSTAANQAALGIKPKPRSRPKPQALPPQKTTITVLNGNGVAGAAANASYMLAQRGYLTLLPKGNADANAPSENYFDSQIYFDPSRPATRAAATVLQALIAPATIHPLPKNRTLRALDPGAMLLVILGETFHDRLEVEPRVQAASAVPAFRHTRASVIYDAAASRGLLGPLARRVPFALEAPTVLDASSVPDTLPGDVPVRLYTIVKGHKAIVLVFHTSANAFWDVEETDWTGAPVLQGRSFTRSLGGRTFQLYYAGSNLHMIVLHSGNTSYWVQNSLLNALSNETMLAIASGLTPLPAAR
jgi:LCP family protein required for cell wall assembly